MLTFEIEKTAKQSILYLWNGINKNYLFIGMLKNKLVRHIDIKIIG